MIGVRFVLSFDDGEDMKFFKECEDLEDVIDFAYFLSKVEFSGLENELVKISVKIVEEDKK